MRTVAYGSICCKPAFVDFGAGGVGCNIRSVEAMPDALLGVFVDMGEHGATNADHINRRSVGPFPDFCLGTNTDGMIVLILADQSVYSGYERQEDVLYSTF